MREHVSLASGKTRPSLAMEVRERINCKGTAVWDYFNVPPTVMGQLLGSLNRTGREKRKVRYLLLIGKG
jgi:hypothetical protein